MSGSSGGATCPPARSSRSSRSGSIDQIARRCESSRQPEQLSVLPTNVGACSYTTSWDLTHVREWRTRARLRKTLVDGTTWLQRVQATLFHHGVSGAPDKLLSAQGREFLDAL